VRCSLARADDHGTVRPVRDLFILAVHLLVTLVRLLRPGGLRTVATESLLVKDQLLISNRSRQRAPNVMNLDRGTRTDHCAAQLLSSSFLAHRQPP